VANTQQADRLRGTAARALLQSVSVQATKITMSLPGGSPPAAVRSLLRTAANSSSQQQAATYNDIYAVRARPHPVTDLSMP